MKNNTAELHEEPVYLLVLLDLLVSTEIFVVIYLNFCPFSYFSNGAAIPEHKYKYRNREKCRGQ